MDRRRFLKLGLVGLALTGAGVAGYFTIRKKEVYNFDKIHDELSDFFSKHDLGKIGRTYNGESESVVLAVHDIYKTSSYGVSAIKKAISELEYGVSLADNVLSDPFVSSEKKKEMAEKREIMLRRSSQRKRILAMAEETDKSTKKFVGACQREIYFTLDHLVGSFGDNVVVGAEGLLTNTDYHSSPLFRLKFDEHGTPQINESAEDFFYNNSAINILFSRRPLIRVVGIEDEELLKQGAELLFVNPDSVLSDKNSIRRNKEAVNNFLKHIGPEDRYAFFIFGSSHFEELKPTLINYFEEVGQSYIEVIPESVSKFRNFTKK